MTPARAEALAYYGGPAVREWHDRLGPWRRPQPVDGAGLSVDARLLVAAMRPARRRLKDSP